MGPPDDGPSEAELAMQKRRQNQEGGGGVDDEEGRELLAENKKLQNAMEEEIQELRERSERRKKERLEEEQVMAQKRQEEEARRKGDEEERKRKKEEEDNSRTKDRAEKMAQMEKFKHTLGKPNFVITKRDDVPGKPADEGEEEEVKEKKSKEQLESEKRAILAQRVQPLAIDGFDAGKLSEKAKELHKDVYRLEGERYDLEKRFKEQQYDMMELAERARQINKVGKGGLKRVQLGQDDDVDKIQEQFAGAPAKVEMYSKYERQMDKRQYGDKKVVFVGPVYGFPADKISPARKVIWDDNTGLPSYEDIPGMEGHGEEEE